MAEIPATAEDDLFLADLRCGYGDTFAPKGAIPVPVPEVDDEHAAA